MAVSLYPHQVKAVKELDNGKILKGGVGTGKTRTALAYFYSAVADGIIRNSTRALSLGDADRLDRIFEDAQKLAGSGRDNAQGVDVPLRPRDIYVISTARKRDSLDWEEEALEFRIGPVREDSIAGIKLTVDSWNNVAKYTDVKDAFFIFDEQRLVGSGSWVKAFLAIAKTNQWIMLSATPGDNWMDYVPVFIANGFFKNRTAFLDDHVVFSRFSKYPKIDRFIGQDKLFKFREQILVEMPYVRHTRRLVENVLVDHDPDLFKKVWEDRWDIYKDEPLQDIGAMFGVARRVVNSDPARLGAVMQLHEKHDRLIIFYNFNYERDMLRTLATTLGVEVREWNGEKHEEVPTGKKWIYIVQYTAGNEAWNCVTTDAMIFFSLNYSWKVNEQAKGRIDRLNTPYTNLHYYILRSASKIDQAIQKSLSLKKDFNEREYVGGKW
jgi:hypothetical protein